MMGRRRHVAATRRQGAGYLGEHRRGKHEVVGLGYQAVEVPARKAGVVGDVPLAAEGQRDGVFLVGLGGEAQDVPR